MTFVPSKPRVKLDENPLLLWRGQERKPGNAAPDICGGPRSQDLQTTVPKKIWGKMPEMINSKKCLLLLPFFSINVISLYRVWTQKSNIIIT